LEEHGDTRLGGGGCQPALPGVSSWQLAQLFLQ